MRKKSGITQEPPPKPAGSGLDCYRKIGARTDNFHRIGPAPGEAPRVRGRGTSLQNYSIEYVNATRPARIKLPNMRQKRRAKSLVGCPTDCPRTGDGVVDDPDLAFQRFSHFR